MKKNSKTLLVILVVVIIVIFLWVNRRASISDENTDTVIKETSAIAPEPAASPDTVLTTTSDSLKTQTTSVAQQTEITPEQLEKIRAEAKLKLVMGYSAQKAFFAEYNRYTTDLQAAGAIFYDDVEMNFKLGFMAPFNASEPADSERIKERPNRMTTDDIIGEESDKPEEKYRYTPNAEKINFGEYATYCKAGCTANEDGFEMLVAVPLLDTGKVDVWSINQKKEMTLVQDGMKTGEK